MAYVLDRFFQILADGAHRLEGTVNQYTGDGIVALLGAPIANPGGIENEALRRNLWGGVPFRPPARGCTPGS